MLVSMKKEVDERERKGGSSNKRSERNFWRLVLKEENNNGNKCSNKEMRNGTRKYKGEKEH